MASSNVRTIRSSSALDTREFSNFAKACRAAAKDVWVDLRAGLREAGEVLAKEIRTEADKFPRDAKRPRKTDRIAQSTKVHVSGTGTTSVVVGGPRAPEAAPIEHGGRPGKFRHLVFGNTENWVYQTAHPFIEPAIERAIPVAEQRAVDALDKAVQTAATRYAGGS